MLVVLLRKQTITQKLLKLKINLKNHDKYTDTSEFNKLAADFLMRD